MSSMLRKGTKQFKPSARPRPSAPRPSSSQPSARPSIEPQSQTQTSATRPLNSIPPIVENVVEEEASRTATSRPIEGTPPEVPIPGAQSQTLLATLQNSNLPEIDFSAKRKAGNGGIEDVGPSGQPPSKVPKLTPPSDAVQHFASNTPSTRTTAEPTTLPQSSTQQSQSPSIAETPSILGVPPTIVKPTLPTTNLLATQSIVAAQPNESPSSSVQAIPNETSQVVPTLTSGKPRKEPSVINGEVEGQNNDTRNLGVAARPNDLSMGSGLPIGESARANGLMTETVESEDADLSNMGAGEASQTSQLVPTVVPVAEETPTSNEGTTPAPKKARKKPAPRKKKVQTEEDGVRATVEVQLNKPSRAAAPKRVRKKKDGDAAKKKKRAETPEGAEDDVIDHTTMKMADLCRDIRIGKKFSKHDEIKQRHTRKKANAQNDSSELLDLGDNGQSDRNAETPDQAAEEPVPIISSNGIQMRVVDGQIVLDDRSLQVDRHRQARDEGLVMEEIEENEFSKTVNSGSYMKRVSSSRWDESANELFYQGLRQFGTAFEMIAAMFPGRNRRQIKLKFVREERENPAKVDRALMGKTETIDFDEYTNLTGQKYEEVADIEAEAKRLDDEQRAEEEAIESAKAATVQKKKDAISSAARRVLNSVGDDDDDGPESQKENAVASITAKGKKKATKPKKKNLHSSSGGGGEEIEVLGTL